MTCINDQAPAAALQFRRNGLWHKLFLVFRNKPKQRVPRLHPRELSDHMKRDLGFLDGRG